MYWLYIIYNKKKLHIYIYILTLRKTYVYLHVHVYLSIDQYYIHKKPKKKKLYKRRSWAVTYKCSCLLYCMYKNKYTTLAI